MNMNMGCLEETDKQRRPHLIGKGYRKMKNRMNMNRLRDVILMYRLRTESMEAERTVLEADLDSQESNTSNMNI